MMNSLSEIQVAEDMAPEEIHEELIVHAPRGPDRRKRESNDGPPWITDEGFIMEDRREGSDRRAKRS